MFIAQALSFMFEYIGEMAKDYIYAVAPLLEDALMDRDLVHRQASITTSFLFRRIYILSFAGYFFARFILSAFPAFVFSDRVPVWTWCGSVYLVTTAGFVARLLM